jgi:biopolymer transport protein ExbB
MRFIVYSLGALLGASAVHAQDAVSIVQGVAAKAPSAPSTTLWTMMMAGGPAMIVLGVMSVITVMLIIVFTFTLRRGAVVSAHFMNTADVLLKKRDYSGLLAISHRHSEAVARVAQRTLDFMTKTPGAGYEQAREIAETEGATIAASLQHRIVYLADIAVLSPMVGLFGTVIGIVNCFGVLGAKVTADANRNMALAGGVGQALVATATGLILGIVAMVFYSIFRGRVQSLVSDLEIASAHLIGIIGSNGSGSGESKGGSRSQSIAAMVDEF